MKFVIQRVSQASVTVEEQQIGSIGKGFLVLVGISNTDDQQTVDKMIKKLVQLRIFEDAEEKTNLDIKAVNGELLIISQFTLYANCKKGNRPSFINAGAPELANSLYEYIIAQCRKEIPSVQSGEFGADMKVSLINDGPFTVILDSDDLGSN